MRTCEAGTPLVAACGWAATDRGHRATGSLASHARMHARTFIWFFILSFSTRFLNA